MKHTALMLTLIVTCGGWTTVEARKLQFDVAEIAHVKDVNGNLDPARSKFVFDETPAYDFGTTPGREMLISEGSEIADLNTPIVRALTGGTSPYSKARGEIAQTMLGFNVVEGVALRFQADVK